MNFVWGSLSFFGFSFTFSSRSCPSHRIRVCIRVRFSVMESFSGVGNQKALLCCFGFFVLSSSFSIVVRSWSLVLFNHTENWCVYWLGQRGLLRRVYVELGKLCLLFHQVRCFLLVSYSEYYFSFNKHRRRVRNYQTFCYSQFLQWGHLTCRVPFW